jgi:Ca-activated chloride channel family protein
VTALYEIIRGKSEERSLQYQQASSKNSDDLATIGLRYKLPQSSESTKIQHTVSTQKRNEASADFDFAAAVAAYSLILRESKYIQEFNLEDVIRLAQEHVHVGEAHRLEFLHLVESTKLLKQVEM